MKNLKLIKSKISRVKFGRNCKVIEPVNLYGCTIGKGTFVGPFVEIQRNAKIGNNTRIQSHTFVCEKVTIGSNCFVSHGVMFSALLLCTNCKICSIFFPKSKLGMRLFLVLL